MIFILLSLVSGLVCFMCYKDAKENNWLGMEFFCFVFSAQFSVVNFALGVQILL